MDGVSLPEMSNFPPPGMDPDLSYMDPDVPYNMEMEEEEMLDDYFNGEDFDGYPYMEDDYYVRISLSELLDKCIIPTLSQATGHIYPLLGLCLLTRLTSNFLGQALQEGELSRIIYHSTSSMCGLVALHLFFQENIVYLVMMALLAYLLLYVTHSKCRAMSGVAVSVITVVYLLTCELIVVDPKEWHRIRGAQMVVAMKVISLAFDLTSSSLVEMPSIWEYTGYVFQVGSVIFGPWISFQDYANLPLHREKKLDFYWVAKLVKSLVAAFGCVVVSTCVVHWLVMDGSFIWLLAYRDAQSFRFSHYFVCFLSELTATLSGLGATKNNGDVRWDMAVSRPLQVELPRSLVEVVTNWNLPMHCWLRNYVFKTARPLGTFAAILLTYAASSLLHGLNFQLAAVLLSLGFYSYIEYVLRNRLSQVFGACIQAKKCKSECQHIYKATNPYVIVVNLGFGILTVFHLAYLGLMFDSSSQEEEGYTMEHTLGKWYDLSFASHWVALATYIFYLLI